MITITVLILFIIIVIFIKNIYEVNIIIDLDNDTINIFYTINGQRKQIQL